MHRLRTGNSIIIISFIISMLFILCPGVTFGQRYEMKMQMSEDVRNELLEISKELFRVEPDVQFVMYSQWDNDRETESSGLDKLENALSKDSLNPVILFRIGYYHSEKGNSPVAGTYYKKAYDNLGNYVFKGDSANFYSLRGMLKVYLEYRNATQDFEKSFSINPCDSLTLVFYPVYLFSQGQLSEAINVCKRHLEHKNIANVLSYFYMSTFAIVEQATEIQKEIKSQENKAKEYQKMDFTQMFDFSLMDKYGERLGPGADISKVRVQTDILALLFKMILLLEKDKKVLYFDNTPNDLKKMTEIEKWLLNASENNQVDHYSLFKNLGFVNYLQNKHDIAIVNLSRVMDMIESYGNFTNVDNTPYSLLLALYYYKNDTDQYRMTIERKIKIDTDYKRLVIDFRNLAFYHFQKGNYETTKKWIEKARKIDSGDFESSRLSAHLYYLDGMKFMTEFYGRELSRHISNPGQAYYFFIQFAVYNLFEENAAKAYENISLARKAYSEFYPRSAKCALCDKLVDNYIKITE